MGGRTKIFFLKGSTPSGLAVLLLLMIVSLGSENAHAQTEEGHVRPFSVGYRFRYESDEQYHAYRVATISLEQQITSELLRKTKKRYLLVFARPQYIEHYRSAALSITELSSNLQMQLEEIMTHWDKQGLYPVILAESVLESTSDIFTGAALAESGFVPIAMNHLFLTSSQP